VRGGLAGGPSSQFRKHRNGLLEPTPGCAEVRIEPGEAMVSISCGGGGYGSPAAREPWRVADDVREGWISAARARSVYQVALTEQLDVDEAETARLRGDVSPTT
jgi:N-methylhydantoinase B